MRQHVTVNTMLIAILLACGTTEINASCDAPTWWTSTSWQEKTYYYGLGEGGSRQGAVAEGHTQLANQLATQISSHVMQETRYKQYTGLDIREDDFKRVVHHASKLHLRGVEPHKYALICGISYAAVRIGKTKAKQQLQAQDKMMQTIRDDLQQRLKILEKSHRALLDIVDDPNTKLLLRQNKMTATQLRRLQGRILRRANSFYNDRKYETALRIYMKLATVGNAYAQYRFGYLLLKKGKRNDGLRWLKTAARNNNRDAQYRLGVRALRAKKGLRNYPAAARYLRQAAAQGLTNAQYNLAILYDKGLGVPVNKAWAARWFRNAATNGHVKAQYNLAVMIANGEGVPQNPEEAARWMEEAAISGHGDAMYNLGLFYREGTGVEENEKTALQWLQRAQDKKNSMKE